MNQRNKNIFKILLGILIFAALFFGYSKNNPHFALGGGSGTIEELELDQVKVSQDDTTPGYLNGKLVAGSGITFTENNNGANETLTISGSGAPSDATYITQTANATLTNEQALSTLSSGIMRVATGTGVITSLTDSAGIAANISDETGTGALVFGTSPTFTTQVLNADGAVGAPSYSFSGDPDTGWYRVGSTMRYADEGIERIRITSAGNISVNNNATGLATSNGLFHGTYDADPNDQDGIVVIDTYSDEGWTTTIGGRRARGTAASPTQVMAGDKLVEFVAKGWDGHGDFSPSNRALVGMYANENWDSSSDNGTYMTLNTTTDNTGANHQSILIDDEGNVAVNDATTSTTTAVFPNLWASTQSKHFVVKTGGAARDGGMFLRNSDDTSGTDIWLDASTASSYIDSLVDSAAGEIIFRHRALGTPVTSLTLNSTSVVSSLPISVDTLTLTGTGTINGLDAIDATSESTIEAAIDTLANLTSVQGKTLTLGGNFITSGASSLTFTTTGATNVTLPTTGTLSTLAGAETLSSKTLTAPKFTDLGFIADANGNELFIWDTVASAVNEMTFANAATGGNPTFTASGGDANVGIDFQIKGDGRYRFLGNATTPGTIRLYEDTDDGTNYTSFKVGTQSADIAYTLPTAAPTSNGMVLSSTTGGVQSWKQSYYTLQAGAAQFNPTDSSTVYFGAPVQASGTDSDESQIQIPLSGTVVAVYVKANTGGTLGTTEDVALNFRLNDTTDTALTAMDFDTQVRKSSTTGLAIAVSAGDAFNIKVVNPAWVTNPTNVRLSAEILIAY